MEVNPQAREFGEIQPISKEMEEKFNRLAKEGKIFARGTEDDLKIFQEDLRQIGYRRVFKP